MTGFDYTEEQLSIQRLARSFAQREIAPGAAERDREKRFDYELYRKLGELGIAAMRLPPEYGGSNADFLSWCLALEELSVADADIPGVLMVAAGQARRLVNLGTAEQKEAWRDCYIMPLARAEATASGAITEPDAGSDTRAIKTIAVLDGDEWVINGSKAFITNAGLENNLFVACVAVTDREKGEFSSILVPQGTPGFTVGTPYETIGNNTTGLRPLYFEDCRVPAFNLIGERGQARRMIVERGFVEARIGVGSMSLGVARACFDAALSYARERMAFHRRLSQFQFVQAMLVDMALELETGHLLRDKAAFYVDQEKHDRRLSSMVKYFCCEAAKKAADQAIQVHGGAGYTDNHRLGRYWRSARALTIADGATEVQKWIVARELGC